MLLFILIIFPEISSPSILIKLCHKCMDLNLWHFVPSYLCKRHAKVSNLLSFFPTFSACPEAHRVVAENTCSSLISALLPHSKIFKNVPNTCLLIDPNTFCHHKKLKSQKEINLCLAINVSLRYIILFGNELDI